MLKTNINWSHKQNTQLNEKTHKYIDGYSRQLHFDSRKDTSTPNFIRLFLMRFIYGIAVNMGIEDQLEDPFNGSFLPPNADDGLGISEYSDDNGDEINFGNLFDYDD